MIRDTNQTRKCNTTARHLCQNQSLFSVLTRGDSYYNIYFFLNLMRKLKCFIPTRHYAKEALTASSITLNMAVAQF